MLKRVFILFVAFKQHLKQKVRVHKNILLFLEAQMHCFMNELVKGLVK